MTSYLVTIGTDYYQTCGKKCLRDICTATESGRCRCNIALEKFKKNLMRGGWHPPQPPTPQPPTPNPRPPTPNPNPQPPTPQPPAHSPKGSVLCNSPKLPARWVLLNQLSMCSTNFFLKILKSSF